MRIKTGNWARQIFIRWKKDEQVIGDTNHAQPCRLLGRVALLTSPLKKLIDIRKELYYLTRISIYRQLLKPLLEFTTNFNNFIAL